MIDFSKHLKKGKNMGAFIFNKDKGIKAGQGTLILTSGVYIGKLTKANFGKTKDGARFVEFDFEERDTDAKASFLNIYLTNKDGSENFAINKIHALMGLLSLVEAPVVKNKDNVESMPALLNKSIGVILQRVNYKNASNEDKYRFEILHFIDAQTKQTFNELEAMKSAEVYKKPVCDIESNYGSKTSATANHHQDSPPTHSDGDLPPFLR